MKHAWTGGQYSLWRVLCAIGLVVAFTHFACATPPLVPGLAETLIGAFGAPIDPDTQSVLHSRWIPVILLFTAAAIALALGARDRIAAFVLLMLWVGSGAWAPERGPIGLAIAGVLVLHMLTPPAPFGSLDAIGRTDPGGSWIRPAWIHAAGWILLAAVGVHAATMPAARDAAAAEFSLSGESWRRLYWLLSLLPFVLPTPALRWVWCASIVLHVATGSAVADGAYSVAGLAVLHAFAFDPGWIAQREPKETELVFYDGQCGLCHRLVRFLLAEDRSGRAFRFAPLQGTTFQAGLSTGDRAALPDSLVLRTDTGAILVRSRAVIHALERLGGVWRVLAWTASIVPVSLADAAYDWVARVRHRLFAAPSDVCPLIPAHLRRRFDA